LTENDTPQKKILPKDGIPKVLPKLPKSYPKKICFRPSEELVVQPAAEAVEYTMAASERRWEWDSFSPNFGDFISTKTNMTGWKIFNHLKMYLSI